MRESLAKEIWFSHLVLLNRSEKNQSFARWHGIRLSKMKEEQEFKLLIILQNFKNHRILTRLTVYMMHINVSGLAFLPSRWNVEYVCYGIYPGVLSDLFKLIPV